MTCYYCKSGSIDEEGGGWCDISGTRKKLYSVYHECSFFEFDTGKDHEEEITRFFKAGEIHGSCQSPSPTRTLATTAKVGK